MAHILLNDTKVIEMYTTHGELSGSVYVLKVYNDGSLGLTWHEGNVSENESNPIIAKIGRGMKVEYGEPNLFGIRRILPFIDQQGKLEDRWKKIL